MTKNGGRILKNFVYKIKYTQNCFLFFIIIDNQLNSSALNKFIYTHQIKLIIILLVMHSQVQYELFNNPSSKIKSLQPKDNQPEDQLSTSFNNLFKNTQNQGGYEKEEVCESTTFPHSMSLSIKQKSQAKIVEITEFECSYSNEQQKIKNYKKPQSKMQKLKKLLPPFMRSKLCPSYQKILEISANIDKYLIKRKKFNCIQNFQILDDQIQIICNRKLTWQIIKQILYIEPQFYKVGKDTFQNFVIGLPSTKENCTLRKQKLRESFFNYVEQKVDQVKNIKLFEEELPQAMIYPNKVSKFYPYNKIQKKSQIKIVKEEQIGSEAIKPTLKKEFLQKLKKFEVNKQKSYQIVENTIILENCRVSYEEFQKFIRDIAESYNQKQVKNMYKSSLIGLLRNKSHDIISIIGLLKMVNQVGLFLDTFVKDQCKILHIEIQQKECILDKFRHLCAGASSFS